MAEQLRPVAVLRLEGILGMSYVTTHVLDATAGRPAGRCRGHPGPRRRRVDRRAGVTNADGRVADSVRTGSSRATTGSTSPPATTSRAWASRPFYPQVSICFSTAADQGHYHVPLLLSPYAYSTYRGS